MTQLNKNTSEVLQWMLDKQDIEVSYSGSDYSYCDYITVLRCLSSIPQYYKFRIKPKEVHGVPCLVKGVDIRSGSIPIRASVITLTVLLARPEQQKLESLLLEPCVLVTKQFFDEAVANKEMK